MGWRVNPRSGRKRLFGVEKTPAGRFLWAGTLAFAVEAGQQPPLVWAGSPSVLILVACLVVRSFVE